MEKRNYEEINEVMEIFDDQLRMLHNRLALSLKNEIMNCRQSVAAFLNNNVVQLQCSQESYGISSQSIAEDDCYESFESSKMFVSDDTVANQLQSDNSQMNQEDVSELLLKLVMHSVKILINTLKQKTVL
uniref:Uncharacterized protein n=1 Tax=Syphacia muris TaxID=451379 RepID=A0A0N5AQN6_9BILA